MKVATNPSNPHISKEEEKEEKVWNLRWQLVGDDDVTKLVSFSAQANSITDIDLTGNRLRQDGWRCIRDLLLRTTSLTRLTLRASEINMNGVKLLSDGIRGNSTLQYLDLQESEIGSKKIERLCRALRFNTSIYNLNLSGNPLGKEGARTISQLLSVTTTLSILNAWWCDFGDEGCKLICRSLRNNTSLISLGIPETEMDEKCAKMFSHNQYLLRFLSSRGYRALTERTLKRNRELWRERLHWCFVLNIMWRVIVTGGRYDVLPMEVIDHILIFVPPLHVLRDKTIIRVAQFSTNRSTLGASKKFFLTNIFGNVADMITMNLHDKI